MICLIQRVTQAHVTVQQKIIGQINAGLVVLVGFQAEDSPEKITKMRHKLLHYRIFKDTQDKMNLNVLQVEGELLLIPQFTLAANTQKGLRPSFSSAAQPSTAKEFFNQFVHQMQTEYPLVQTGEFGADMQVTLTNDGPVTFWLEI
ncbi:MAG: D-aminoacyl-tRNA deacylase [Thiomicrorhabdus sp.]|nr:D-aminoacyl-tRNA deacylase [Thiomicrorhabdus sp.]